MKLEHARLEKLAILLDGYRHDPNRPDFNLKSWGVVETRRRGFLWLKRVECGTTACAVGLACLSGAFAADGLTYEIEKRGMIPLYGDCDNWEAVEAFFGLTRKQSTLLFSADEYLEGSGTPLAVAKRIRALVDRSRRAAQSRRPRTFAAVQQIKERALDPVH
jgi:hypothetical protein